MILFEDFENEYKFLDFTLSHSQLLIRSMKNRDRNYNIDLIFKGVSIILSPTILSGVSISFCESVSEEILNLKDFGLQTGKDDKIFEIRNLAGNIHYINAYAFGVFHNTLEILETSICRHNYRIPGENVLWFKG